MNDVVFTSFFLIEIYFTIVLVVNCAIDELLPIGEYKTWLQNKNWFGKIYTAIVIIFTIPAAIIIYIYRSFHCVLNTIYSYAWN